MTVVKIGTRFCNRYEKCDRNELMRESLKEENCNSFIVSPISKFVQQIFEDHWLKFDQIFKGFLEYLTYFKSLELALG